MIIIELLLRIMPSIFIMFILEKLVKLAKFEKIYLLFILILTSNVFVYYIFQNTGMIFVFTPSLMIKLSIALFIINIFIMYIFTLIRLRKNK